MPTDITQIPHSDYAHVHESAVMANVALTPQEERFVTLVCHGFGPAAASRHCGMQITTARALMEDERVTSILTYMKELYADAVNVTRETITVMLLEAHRKAASAGEEIMAAKELGKLHGLYKSDENKGTKITNNTQINGNVSVGTRKLARMTDADLIEMANFHGVIEHGSSDNSH